MDTTHRTIPRAAGPEYGLRVTTDIGVNRPWPAILAGVRATVFVRGCELRRARKRSPCLRDQIEKRKAMNRLAATILALSTLVCPALAHTISAGSLTIGPVWTRATPPGASSAGGYLTVVNQGTEPDKLVEVEFAAASAAGLHRTLSAGNVSAMRPVNAITIPAGQTTRLRPDGFHIMFTGLTERLRQGQMVEGALVFEKAGRVPVEFRVERIGATEPTPE